MFVDNIRKLVFIHVPKTGGTSISHTLSTFGEVLKPTHTTYTEAIKLFPDYYFFCFVRNPWDRIYSNYEHMIRRNKMPFSSFDEYIINYDKKELFSQERYVTNYKGLVTMDFIGRTEYLHRDFNYICKKFYKDNMTLSTSNYYRSNIKNMSSEANKIIETYCEWEITTFGYNK